MSRIGLITTDAFARVHPDPDLEPLRAALEAAGEQAEILVWHEDDALSGFDALVIRSPWDYPEKMQRFSRWLDRVEEAGVTLLNPAELVRWNIDKRYLLELAEHGVAITPTEVLTDPDGARRSLASKASEQVVVKPAVSGGARSTGLFQADDPAAAALATSILAEGMAALLQPAIPEIAAGGERDMYFLDGAYSHAISKGPLLAPGGGLLGGTYTEVLAPVEPTEAEKALGLQVLAALRSIGQERGWSRDAREPLYARIDVVTSAAHGPLLIEAELIEPQLNLALGEGATGRMVGAIRSRLQG